MLPNQNHGYGSASAYMMRRRWDYFVKWLIGVEPPKEYQMQAAAAAGRRRRRRRAPTKADMLRGAYGPYRANNDLLSYHLDIRVDPEKKFISGKNTIRFRMLKDDTRIQLDLTDDARQSTRSCSARRALKYERELGRGVRRLPGDAEEGPGLRDRLLLLRQPEGDRAASAASPSARTRPAATGSTPPARASARASGGPTRTSSATKSRTCASASPIPNDLVDVSNGKFLGKTDLGDGYTRWDWLVQYPINNYSVSLNIGKYEHFTGTANGMTLDFYCLPEDLEKAKKQFAQAKSMIECFEKYFGEYPFKKDGYKLIEAPYSGMEHQSAVTYGNHFANGYLERDWTGVGVSLKFDFIIIHESAHEWFGNSVTAADVADMWIHEGWGTYLECVYVEHMFGYDDALKYINGYKSKVRNREPIITPRGINRTPPQDMYFKGALFINTLRSVVDDDTRWWKLVRDFYQHFKYQNITTDDVVAFFNQQTGQEPDADLRPVPAAHASSRRSTLQFQDGGQVAYRWQADVPGIRHADQGRPEGPVADHHADDRVADDDDAAHEGRVRGGDGPVLRQRQQAVGGDIRDLANW